MKESKKDIHWSKCDPNHQKCEEIRFVINKVAKELLQEGYSETLIYAYLHKTVDIALYEAIVEFEIGG